MSIYCFDIPALLENRFKTLDCLFVTIVVRYKKMRRNINGSQ